MTTTMATLARIDPVTGEPDAPRTGPVPAATFAPRSAWPVYLGAWVALVVLVLAVFHRDTAHLATRWWHSSTYGHCLLIPPIIAWLVWQRKEGLARLAPSPWMPGALLMLGCGLLWLVGEFSGAAVIRHAALVLIVMASVPTIFGLTIARAVKFPIFFALFMIPVGEQLEPYLQTITAHFAVWLLRLLGVPTHMDGVFISIPNGDFEVAQACSGVRFLIAMVAFGALVANVCFLSVRRRLAFMAAAFILPVVANGIRVWGTIHIAYVTTPEFARGVDHVVYGWVFFAVVMALLLAVGWRYFDRPVDDPFIYPEKLQRPGTAAGPPRRLLATGAAALIAASIAPAYAAVIEARQVAFATARLAFAAPAGWTTATYRGEPWRPIYKGATAEAMQSFVDASGHVVDLYVAVYDRQDAEHEVVRYGNGIVELLDEGGWAWAADGAPIAGGAFQQINKAGSVRDVAQYFWVNGRLVGSPYAAKVEGLKARALGGEPRAATVIVAAERSDGLVSARPAIERFVAAAGPIDRLVERSVVAGAGAGS